MEERGITFTGITQATSDLDCKDGDLSISHNIISENGAMRPIVMPDVSFSLNPGEQLLYIHKGDGYKNYIMTTSTHLSYFTDEHKTDRTDILTIRSKILQIVNIGNSVAVLFNSGIIYLLYKDNKYKVLGSKPPELNISFGLVGDLIKPVSNYKIECNGFKLGGGYSLDENSRDNVTDIVIGKINESLSEAKTNNLFCHPFYVCYAYKLLGQSDYMVSAPVLMRPVEWGMYPFVEATSLSTSGDTLKGFNMTINVCRCMLDYRIDSYLLELLKDWSEVITSVDIYVSPEIPLFNQEGKISSINEANPNILTDYTCKLGTFTRDRYTSEEDYNTLRPVYAEQGQLPNASGYVVKLPKRDSVDINRDIENTGNFYLYQSYKINTLKSVDIIRPSGDVLTNLFGQPRLNASEDYNSHDLLSAKQAFVYNGRLNIVGVSKSLYGFTPAALVPFNNGEKLSNNGFNGDRTDYAEKTYTYKMTFLVKEDDKIIKAVSGTSQLNNVDGLIFYPNPKVDKMLIEQTSSSGTYYVEEKFKTHMYLNSSFTTDDSRQFGSSYPSSDYNVGTEAYDYNKVYTSDIGSIFNFPLSGRTTVGTGSVLGISAISKALSPGQFGQFPLYVFSTEGVWAMEVNPNTGFFSSVHLISRDVCSNGSSIAQIDGAVLFASEKGVMIVDGSEVKLVSAEMDGPNFNMISVDRLQEVLNKEGMLEEVGSMIRFGDYLRDCKMAYDYPNSRVIIFRPDMNYAYVYSLNARSWATTSANFKHVVTDYPNVYLQRNDNSVLDLFEKINHDSGKESKTILLSRPVKFGSIGLKSVCTVITRGLLRGNKRAIIVFASLDGSTYFPVGSATGNRLTRLEGTPYKYFRLCVVGDMEIDEALSIVSVYIKPKWSNKPR